jgi:hypothetical protein
MMTVWLSPVIPKQWLPASFVNHIGLRNVS